MLSVLADKTMDIQGVEQRSICCRYVLYENNQPVLKEDFIALIALNKLDTETIANKILSSLQNYGLDLNKLVGQVSVKCSDRVDSTVREPLIEDVTYLTGKKRKRSPSPMDYAVSKKLKRNCPMCDQEQPRLVVSPSRSLTYVSYSTASPTYRPASPSHSPASPSHSPASPSLCLTCKRGIDTPMDVTDASTNLNESSSYNILLSRSYSMTYWPYNITSTPYTLASPSHGPGSST
ncbi:Hypothetical protein CINCED_3A000730 [Cinara cedri]|uniref:Uncharacterized protein n=1 Tax=Cinara cedri TaxID=506608 RepID=A0A5E4NSL1_9HEMI|nr:Hypothetical protein CINCED_3A000730 [Cinara cedri]